MIEWTDVTWNPVRGCSPVSPGCANCYAERVGARMMVPEDLRVREWPSLGSSATLSGHERSAS
jgi:protein gp37